METYLLTFAFALALALMLSSQVSVKALSNEIYARTANYFMVRCNVFTDSATCASGGCYWWGGICNIFPSSIDTDYCITIDEDIQLCFTTSDTKYLLINTGTYQEAIGI